MSARTTPRSATSRGVSFWRSVIWATFLIAGGISMLDPLDLFSYSVTPICHSIATHVAPNDKPNAARISPGVLAIPDGEAAQPPAANGRMPHNSDLREHEAEASLRSVTRHQT